MLYLVGICMLGLALQAFSCSSVVFYVLYFCFFLGLIRQACKDLSQECFYSIKEGICLVKTSF
jgi:hypothetical protein